MGVKERDLALENGENRPARNLVFFDLESYSGNSKRIEGFRRIKETVGVDIPGVQFINPIILPKEAYDEYKNNRASVRLRELFKEIWEYLDGENHPLIVRRLFPDENGDSQDGPRSGNVETLDVLTDEIGKIYDFYYHNYDEKDARVSAEIMVHRLIDAGNPPKYTQPFLPHPGGDVYLKQVPDKYEVRATYGADESVQGYPADVWQIIFSQDGSLEVRQIDSPKKRASRIPTAGNYIEIEIPEEFCSIPALTNTQVVSIAEVCRKMNQSHGPHRMEFDGTSISDREVLVVIEAVPFEVELPTPEAIEYFTRGKSGKIVILDPDINYEDLPQSGLAFVYLPDSFFKGNDIRKKLNDVALNAFNNGVRLIAFAHGRIGTQHAGSVYRDCGHTMIFVGDEKFEDGEGIRVFARGRELIWERENPIVLQKNIGGRTLDRIGGKAIGLQKLQMAGFTTSPYFVIETSVYRRIMEKIDMRGLLSKIGTSTSDEKIREISDRIAKEILKLNLKEFLQLDEVLSTFDGEEFSVRSSATCEDGEHSFAGQFHTELEVKRDRINRAVLKVLASTVDYDVIRMCKPAGIEPYEIQMAVIVQKMVEAKKAGTIFTKSTTPGHQDCIRIEAARGAGSEIVDGTAKKIHGLDINKETQEISRETKHLEQDEILTDNEINQLVRLGLNIENGLRGPQDIEWAIDKYGKIFILQSRPLRS